MKEIFKTYFGLDYPHHVFYKAGIKIVPIQNYHKKGIIVIIN